MAKICEKRVKIRPFSAKKWSFFGYFPSFSNLEICPVNEFFCFFNMVFLSVFRSYFHKIVKKGSKFVLEGPKISYLCYFCSFLDIKFFLMKEFSDFSLWCFWAYLEVIYKKLWKKDQILKGWKNDVIFQISHKLIIICKQKVY